LQSPSIAAVTASFNMSAMGYSMHIQHQPSKQELIRNMGEILPKMITKFREVTKSWPKRIIMFRDGVSEGYFDEVKAVEFEDMKRSAESACKGFKPKMAFLVVKKRHHTRFQPMEKAVGNVIYN
jgi:eukaryotic translation initiation factor 2C